MPLEHPNLPILAKCCTTPRLITGEPSVELEEWTIRAPHCMLGYGRSNLPLAIEVQIRQEPSNKAINMSCSFVPAGDDAERRSALGLKYNGVGAWVY